MNERIHSYEVDAVLPYDQGGKHGLKRFSNRPMVTQLISGTYQIFNPGNMTPKHIFLGGTDYAPYKRLIFSESNQLSSFYPGVNLDFVGPEASTIWKIVFEEKNEK